MTEAMPTLVGAALAFFLGFTLYKKQRREENKVYLHYSVSALSYLQNHLYNLKEQIVLERYKKAVTQIEKLKKVLENKQDVHLQLDKTAKYIYGADFQLAIGMEKLAFLVKRDPNLIILLGTVINSVKSLNHIVTDINGEISEYSRQTESLDAQYIMLMLEKNILLSKQVDSTIYLSRKFLDLIVEFGHLEYRKEMKTRALESTVNKYKELKPQAIKSWEETNWFPNTKTWRQRVLEKMRMNLSSKQ